MATVGADVLRIADEVMSHSVTGADGVSTDEEEPEILVGAVTEEGGVVMMAANEAEAEAVVLGVCCGGSGCRDSHSNSSSRDSRCGRICGC